MTGGPYRNPPMAVALRRETKPNQFEMGISPCRPAATQIESEAWPPPQKESRTRSSSPRWWPTSGATPAPTPSAHGSGTPPPSTTPFSPTPRPNRFLCRSIDRLIRARPLFARGVRKMERALPPATLREKLPRFLQKCAQEFQDDARYRDDPRYLRVWIQLVTHPPTPIAATTRLGPLPRPLFTADPMHHKFMVGLLSK